MMPHLPLRLALTIDDAPSVAGHGALRSDPSRLDIVRELLQTVGIRHCVAFVVSSWAQGHESALARWLDAGFELGNHSDNHKRASDIGPQATIASLERCDLFLSRVGAFGNGRSRYYRAPYGDRGANPDARRRLLEAMEERGYASAEVSIDLFDYRYEEPLAQALIQGDLRRARTIEKRFLSGVDSGMSRAAGVSLGDDGVHVACAHFGLVLSRVGQCLFERLSQACHLETLATACNGEVYAKHATNVSHNRILAELVPDSLTVRIVRGAFRIADRLGLTATRRLGPRWPNWQR